MINKKLKRESGNCLIRAPRCRPWKLVQLMSMCGHEEALRAMLERGAFALTSSSTVHADADADAAELLLFIDRFEMIDPSQIINSISQSHNLAHSLSSQRAH